MTYNKQYIAAIKSNGKILRENNSTVALPYGAEYSILLKNMKSVRALVEVTIDGESATDKTKLIIPANSELELKRYIKNRNFNKGNAFKFIEKTDAVEKHRGSKIDDGLVRVEFWEETPLESQWWYTYNSGIIGVQPSWTYPVSTTYTAASETIPDSFTKTTLAGAHTETYGSINCMSAIGQSRCVTDTQAMNCSVTPSSGITVPGSVNDQKFVSGSWFPTNSNSVVIVLQLIGKIGNQQVSVPITVQTKPTCNICGRVNKATNKFCCECGAGLQLV